MKIHSLFIVPEERGLIKIVKLAGLNFLNHLITLVLENRKVYKTRK